MPRSDELLALAVEAAHAAGELLLERFGGTPMGVETKSSPTDPVSDADRAAERLLMETIRRARPDDGILSEEGGRTGSRNGLLWVIDPLDGTVNFLYGLPTWSVSIAIADAEGALAAVVHDPSRGETFTASRGGGTRLNGEAVRVRALDDLSRALIGTGFSYEAEARAAQAERMPRVLPRVRDVRRAGSAALDLSWVSCGRLDGFFEAPMKEWDKAAGILLIREAGGVVSELPAPSGDDHGVIAASPGLHDHLRELVLDEGG